MAKITILVGHTASYNKARAKAGRVEVDVELRQTEKGPELSICGAVWDRNGSDIDMGGQCLDHLAAEVSEWNMDRDKFDRILEIWAEYHLNGMKAGCEHQRAEGWRICQGHYLKGEAPYLPRLRKEIKEGGGHCAEVGYAWLTRDDDGIMVVEKIFATVENCAGEKESSVIGEFQRMVRCSLDMLGKPCTTCGYKYGHEWLYMPIPEDVLQEILGWFPSDYRDRILG